MGVMETITAVLTITVPIIGTLLPTIVLTNRQTQQLLREIKKVQEDTVSTLEKVRKLQGDTTCTLKKVRKVQVDTNCLLKKVDLGLRANALMHGWKRVDNIAPKEARKIPGPKVYDRELGICYYRYKSGKLL